MTAPNTDEADIALRADQILGDAIYICERYHPTLLDLCFGHDDVVLAYENYVYNEIQIPERVEILIIEFNVKKLILPNSLRVLDYSPFISTDLEFNIPPNLESIIIRDTNIIGKEFYELFQILYSDGRKSDNRDSSIYSMCSLNGVELHTVINTKYTKYFGKAPRYNTTRLYNQLIHTNVIQLKYHASIIREIIDYEARIKQGREFRLAVKEELVAMAWHPRRVDKWIYADIDLLDL